MKRAGLWIGLVVVGLVAIVLVNTFAGGYNALTRGREEVKNQFAQVDNQLQRRNDLIGSLVETVKGTAIQEQEVFGKIAEARAQMSGAHTANEKIAAGQQMDGALGRLLVVIESYPQLKSNEAFLGLMDEISGTENRLATERMRYNEKVRDYNLLVKQFPSNIAASLFHFEPATYYEIPDSARQAPKVDFGGLRNYGNK